MSLPRWASVRKQKDFLRDCQRTVEGASIYSPWYTTEPEGKTRTLPPVLLSGLYKVTLTSKVIMEGGKEFSFVSGFSSGNLSSLFLNVNFLFFSSA